MKRILFTRLLVPLIFLLAGFTLTACSFLPQITTVEGEEFDQIVALGEPLADNLFQGMKEGNYTLFSRDFDPAMKKALDQEAFNEMNRVFNQKIGLYQSREIEKVELVDTVYVITYQAKFEKENPVAVRLSLRQGDAIQVAGLYFDSPKLREK